MFLKYFKKGGKIKSRENRRKGGPLTNTYTTCKEGGGEVVPVILSRPVIEVVVNEPLDTRIEASFGNTLCHDFVVE